MWGVVQSDKKVVHHINALPELLEQRPYYSLTPLDSDSINTMCGVGNDMQKRTQITKLLSLYTANLLSQRQENPVRGQHGVVA